ncbi:Ubiquitin system component cue [Globisporangium polare]
MSSTAPIKICYKGEIHRFRLDVDNYAYESMLELFRHTFTLKEGTFVLQYTDPDGDVVTIADEVEFRASLETFKEPETKRYRTVRYTAAPRHQVVFQENVADPILKAIEKLVETLAAAMEKVKHEDWKLRAQSGVDATNDALKSAAADARESLLSARQSIQEIPFDQMLKETTEGIKAAAEGISVFAKEVVEEMKKEKLVQDAAEGLKTAAESVSVFAKDAVDELKNMQLPGGMAVYMPSPVPMYTEAAANTTVEPAQEEVVAAEVVAEVAETAPVSADSDWEQVAEQVTTPAVEEEIVEVVVSEEEKKWAAQLATIRDIFPNVDAVRAIERLEQTSGNVELVLNALMEEM